MSAASIESMPPPVSRDDSGLPRSSDATGDFVEHTRNEARTSDDSTIGRFGNHVRGSGTVSAAQDAMAAANTPGTSGMPFSSPYSGPEADPKQVELQLKQMMAAANGGHDGTGRRLSLDDRAIDSTSGHGASSNWGPVDESALLARRQAGLGAPNGRSMTVGAAPLDRGREPWMRREHIGNNHSGVNNAESDTKDVFMLSDSALPGYGSHKTNPRQSHNHGGHFAGTTLNAGSSQAVRTPLLQSREKGSNGRSSLESTQSSARRTLRKCKSFGNLEDLKQRQDPSSLGIRQEYPHLGSRAGASEVTEGMSPHDGKFSKSSDDSNL